MTPAPEEVLQRLQALATGAVDRSKQPRLNEPDKSPAPFGAGDARVRTLRVDVDALDRLLDLAGEMAVGRGRLKEALEGIPGGAAQTASEIHSEADRLHADLQELVMKARMEPLGPTFQRFARTVRDLGATLGKAVRLLIEGEDVFVDTKIIEHVRDPLTHLVRNALSHGLERPAERAARGKDPRGLVCLRAFRETGGIVIEVEDDGLGLSKERIAQKARELGLLAETEGLTEAGLLDLIFEPGFSTASAVTEVSGRGVGLDVVRRNVEALRGSVRVTSREGVGTTFTIRLPLSISIIPGFAVRAGHEIFILPLEAVLECFELPEEGLRGNDGTGVVSLRGEPLPCRRLRDRFELGGESRTRELVVVVQQDGPRRGLVVDAILGESQTVLKPLGRLFRGLPGIAGSAILGSGRIALVVDLPGLFREAA
jgi:two-component system chemotaxis sensor kinase CheA